MIMPDSRLHGKEKEKKKVSGIAMDPEVYELIDQAAHKLDRSRSWVVEHLCREGLKAGLHLKPRS